MALRPQSFNRLLQRHGTDCTLTVVTEGAYDPATATNANTLTPYTVRCHPANYKLEDVTVPDLIQGHRQMMVQATDTSGVAIPKPKSGDTIEGLGDKVQIIEVDEFYSLGVVFYLCMVRE